MNNAQIAFGLLILAINAQASCPKKLTGKYVSSVEYTIMSKVSQPPGYENSVADVRYDITSAEIKNGTLTFVTDLNRQVKAGSGLVIGSCVSNSCQRTMWGSQCCFEVDSDRLSSAAYPRSTPMATRWQ